MFEKRKSTRRVSLERCTVQFYGSNTGLLETRVINYSETGFMLEMDHPLEQGMPVKIKLDRNTSTSKALGQDFFVGMVRWCFRQEGDLTGMYGVGIEMSKLALSRVFQAA